jgi:molybdate transport system ATP-binding protein
VSGGADRLSTTAPPIVTLDAVTAVRAGGDFAVRDLNWSIRDGETWAIVGPVGSGKTALAETLLGRHHVRSGEIRWPLIERVRATGRLVGWPADVVQLVSFKEESGIFSYGKHYYQQRFNFIEPQDDLTLGEFLRAGTSATDGDLISAAEKLGVGDLLPLSLIKLSNGQMRRARLAHALLAKPELLILDEPFLGLDVEGRGDVATLLGQLVRGGLPIVLITRPETLPGWVTHVLAMDRLTATWRGPREAFLSSVAGLGEAGSSCLQETRGPASQRPATEEIIGLYHVSVAYGDRPILRDVSWTVRAGERWAVLGPNGSGKTTLLSLICADHPQAYSNEVYLFGSRRGTGESIWEIKRRIGLVSPELHLYFTAPLTAFETAATGFFDVLTYRSTTPEQAATVRRLFEEFGIATLAERPFARLSTGEQRLVLLVRALVKEPPLLILDEPFQGLDDESIERARSWLDDRLRPDQTLIFVTHHAREIPRCVTRRLRLCAGQVAEIV